MKRLLGVALIAALSHVLSGCGYALAGRGSFLPSDIRIMGIPLLENRTPVPRIDQIFTEKIRTEFIERGGGKYEIRPTQSGAHAVLSGAITSITYNAVGLTEQQQASRYLFTVTMRVQLTDSRDGQVLWSNESLTFREEYDLRTRSNGQLDGAVLLEQEGPAMDRLGSDLARSVVTAILEAF
jgi:outer membrane lipopolysaccharide assembly protein LptE/RlpB